MDKSSQFIAGPGKYRLSSARTMYAFAYGYRQSLLSVVSLQENYEVRTKSGSIAGKPRGGGGEQRSSRFNSKQQSTARKKNLGKRRNILRKTVPNYKHLLAREDTGAHEHLQKSWTDIEWELKACWKAASGVEFAVKTYRSTFRREGYHLLGVNF